MILDKDVLKKLRDKLSIIDIAFTLYPNGIFNALDVEESYKDKLITKLTTLGILKNLSAHKYRIDNNQQLYSITGIIDYDTLNEEIELHDTLNSKLWDNNEELLPEVREKIEDIVKLFKEQLEEDGVKLTVEDIVIVGSNANYNYNDASDLDIHIIADESFDCNSKHLDIIYNAYKALFNKKYDIRFNGINVEIYVESSTDLSRVANGVYSLNSGWIKKPARYDIPKIDEATLDKLIAKWEARYLTLIENNPTINDIETYIDDIYKLRETGLKTDGEFSLDNLTFKEIRRLGYLDNLKNLKDTLLSDSMSL